MNVCISEHVNFIVMVFLIVKMKNYYFTKLEMKTQMMHFITTKSGHSISSSFSGAPLKYSTLLHRIKTSPRFPVSCPSIYSSVLAS
jgi:hypothetical protein